MKRSEKITYVENLRSSLDGASLVVAARQGGLTVGQMTSLRAEMRRSGGSVKVLKNTLAARAVEGSKFEGMTQHFVGPVVIGYSKDPVAAAKVFVEFANKNDRLEVIAGNLDGQPLVKRSVEDLAKLPPIDELRGKILGVLMAPATKLACVLQAPGSQVARVVSAYAHKS